MAKGRYKSSGHTFSQIPKAHIQRSKIDRSHGVLSTFDAGFLIPIFVDEALPGDTFTISMSGFARLATPLKPIMDNLYLETFWFAVPNRLLWDNWQRFNGERPDPDSSTDFLTPVCGTGAGIAANGSIYDHMGLPTGKTNLEFQAMPFRAYNLIWNEWFRSQDLQDSVSVPTGNGPDPASTYALLRRGKRHDYFTSALPFPQKGDSVSAAGPVSGIGKANQVFNQTGVSVWETDATAQTSYQYAVLGNQDNANSQWAMKGSDPTAGIPEIYADIEINNLRQAFQIQRLLERDARGGTRYTEIIRSHFGVVSPDARLQRPEYLGGGSTPIHISPVAQTSGSAVDPSTGYTPNPQGNLAAIGTAAWQGHGFHKSFTEHCVVLGLASVRADLKYQQGLERMWSRRTRFDFFWPALSNLGEQAILSKEIFFNNEESDNDVWGYQERWAEYRYKPSRVTGKFRSNDAESLDFWHLAQDFGVTRPTLSPEFIEENPPVARVIAVPTEPHFIADIWFNYKAARPMPLYSVPGMIDHF